MKNDIINVYTRWQQWQRSPTFFKEFFIYISLFVFFILSTVIIIHRYNKKKPIEDALINTKPISEFAPLELRITQQNRRLTALEKNFNQLKISFQTIQQVITLEMFQEVLDGSMPLKSLTLYLRKHPTLWTADILRRLSRIKESKTYAQLQGSLILPQVPQPLSMREKIKHIIKYFVKIRKLKKEDHKIKGTLKDIQKALYAHNIQQALDAFDKLSPQEQAQLASWKQEAQTRLTLEKIKRKMLLNFSEN